VNQITIYGHLGQNAELKYTKNGSAVLSFSVATEEVWHDDKGRVETIKTKKEAK
jgi:single-stranded DNA-binding protein